MTARVHREPVFPPPIGREAAFVEFTYSRRFPKIAQQASAVLSADTSETLHALVRTIIAGGAVDSSAWARPTQFWSEYLDERARATWADLPFFDAEFLFYHAINSLSHWFTGGVDAFRKIRREAIESGLAKWSSAASMLSLEQAVWAALLANEADYSLLSVSDAASDGWHERLVVDDRAQLLDALAPGGHSVHIVADNAGPELLADLALVDVLLTSTAAARVTMHCKPCPMFVSDALIEDAEFAITALANSEQRSLAGLGARLQHAQRAQRLLLEAHVGWGEPRHFHQLPPELTRELANSNLVIAKGDLNYRRFVGDRAWPATTDFSAVTPAVPFDAFALRVLKSDALVGVSNAAAARAARTSAAWRTDASHALIQKIAARPRA